MSGRAAGPASTRSSLTTNRLVSWPMETTAAFATTGAPASTASLRLTADRLEPVSTTSWYVRRPLIWTGMTTAPLASSRKDVDAAAAASRTVGIPETAVAMIREHRVRTIRTHGAPEGPRRS